MFYRYKSASGEPIRVRGLLFTKEWKYSDVQLPLPTGDLIFQKAMTRKELERMGDVPFRRPIQTKAPQPPVEPVEMKTETPQNAQEANTPPTPAPAPAPVEDNKKASTSGKGKGRGRGKANADKEKGEQNA